MATEEDKAAKHRSSSYIMKHIERYPDLRYDGITVVCPLCNVRLVTTNLFNWRKHLTSQKHQRNKQINLPYALFLCDVVMIFSMCNIPFNVLDKKPFRHFWKKYAPGWSLPSRTSAWRKMSNIKRLVQERIKEELKDNQIWLTVDETTDAKGNNVLHVLGRALQPDGPSPTYLMTSRKMDAVTPEAIQQIIVNSLTEMNITESQVLMLVTSSRQYMLKAGRLLKYNYGDLVHLTCTIHSLHRVAEEVQKNYPVVDQIMVSLKEVMGYPGYTKTFHSICPDIPLPPNPVSKHGATWLEAASYYHQHFDKIKSFVSALDPQESQVIVNLQEQFGNQQFETDLRVINENYSILGESIRKLGSSTLSLAKSLDVLDKVQTALENLKDAASVQAIKKFDHVLKTNPDYLKLRFINQCLIDNYPVDSLQPFFMYANISSVDIERSVPHYSDVFTARRRRFVETNMEALMLIQMFAQSLETAELLKKQQS